MRKGFILILTLFLMITLFGCSSEEASKPVEVDQPVAEVEDQKEKEEKVEVPKFIAPLTGLPTEKDLSKTRIIGVMIENHFEARPQTGLDQADMVYEILAEGMITRFIGIYHSQEPEVIGPVRSIRPYYIHVIDGFDALIGHAGQSPQALVMLDQGQLPDLDEIRKAGAAYWRENFRKAPHNLYTSIEKLRAAAEQRNYRTDGYIPTFPFFKDGEIASGTEAKNINIKYYENYYVDYEYDEANQIYKRSINGKPHIDLETKEQLTAKNILVVQAAHKIFDSVGRREVDVYGPGKGFLFQNGVVQEVTWERKDGVIRPFINGKEQPLHPGQTWTIFIPNTTNVSYR